MVFLMSGLTNVADYLNAGMVMRDRGRYKRAGTFVWLPSGNNGFTGVVLGYAPGVAITSQVDTVSGSVGIDGGVAMPVYGWGAIEIDRWCAGSVQVNGGVAWGVQYPPGANIPSYAEMLRALDNTHKAGAFGAVTHNFQYSPVGGTLVSTTDVVNQTGGGVLKALSCMIDYVPPGTTQNASLALDVSTDGAYRFSVGVTRRTLNGDFQTPGMTASVGLIPYSSSLNVHLRRAHDGTQMQVWSSVLFYPGA